MPFVAIVQGRQRLVIRELPWVFLVGGVILAAGIRHVHEHVFAWHGAGVMAVLIIGPGFYLWRGRRDHRRRLQHERFPRPRRHRPPPTGDA